ncbi:DHA2 family multidrug resistance protein-like MFS transporter [Crossiella equi]|uniref:DHA2 family multidrug resistance protein-like MFS transporter n=3 Tax=Crossiella equi TaxID=130796 RepID=A0ABS5AKJ4_9PSEU|nr:MFS transporter [Crossiella equi]MBP2477093.1 DHA2 family multidrug resistance protein-like MFS transporter [Crossiella equi]
MTERAGMRQWVGLAVLVLPALLVAMDLSVLLFAVPFLSAELRPSAGQLLWIMDVYGFLLAGLLVTMGTLGDRIGRRKLLLAGGALFGVASVLAAHASSPELLIAARVLLGVGGATLAPATLALIRALFADEKQRSVAISVWTAAFAGGAVLGPVLGGVLLENFHWGTAFLVNVPAMALLVVLGPLVLPESRDPEPGPFDLVSALLSLLAALPVVYGIKQLAADGLTWPALAAIAVGLGFGVVFVHRQRTAAARGRSPLLDLGLFRAPGFGTALLAATLTLFAIGGITLFTSQYLQTVLEYRPFTAALWGLPVFAGMATGTALAPVLTRGRRTGRVIAAGLLVGAAGLLLLTAAGVGRDGLWPVVGGMTLTALGLGLVTALANDLVLAAAPPERAGAAAALSETGTELGGALGMALLGSIGLGLVYRREVGAALPPELPEPAATAARETLAGAVRVAGELPGGQALAEAARAAFVSGMQVTVTVAAGILVLAALFAWNMPDRAVARPDRVNSQ